MQTFMLTNFFGNQERSDGFMRYIALVAQH